jgi:hypothetical protein
MGRRKEAVAQENPPQSGLGVNPRGKSIVRPGHIERGIGAVHVKEVSVDLEAIVVIAHNLASIVDPFETALSPGSIAIPVVMHRDCYNRR